jgi:hypothetical protein
MRFRSSLLLLLLLLLACLPAGSYELLQKLSERRSLSHGLFALSAQAEAQTPWRPRTGTWWIDHTEHELRETRRFYALLADEIVAPIHLASRSF